MKPLYLGLISLTVTILAACSSCSGNASEVPPSDEFKYTDDVEYYNFSPRLKESQLYAG